MSKKRRGKNPRDTREYRLSVRAVRRETPDINKLARAIIDLAMAQAEREAQAEQEAQTVTEVADDDKSRDASE
ncbi:hypothetical protein EV138_1104 [Kribbella voronezhensis]|uniref:Uncharacterized protein n=1 Tax=Kribbella voronezhensis TaxID=2512212 RepID=A0A4R7T6Q7_9ACTN|nr:hypothetical protein [Kribbella voronezhensis]TDU87580.1 hypothetical protein EV138_1104 [Kribbella voronezhensis]